MKNPIYIILLPFLIFFLWSCNQKVTLVLPLVGLYEGRILDCDAEEIARIDSVMDSVTVTSTPYVRRVAIAYVDDFVVDTDSIVQVVGVKANKKFLVIKTNWLCLKTYPADKSPLDTLSSEKLLQAYPVVVQVKNSAKGRTNFEMVAESQLMLDLGGNSSLHISRLTGFYYNGALQLEYVILKDGRGQPLLETTMVGMKN